MSAENNGGKTGYYDLPRPELKEIVDVIDSAIEDILSGRRVSIDIAYDIFDLFPSTLNDIIEHQNMKPWQHEVFKACYALDARAEKNGGSEEREINKIIYYAQRGLNLVRNKK